MLVLFSKKSHSNMFISIFPWAKSNLSPLFHTFSTLKAYYLLSFSLTLYETEILYIITGDSVKVDKSTLEKCASWIKNNIGGTEDNTVKIL